MHIFKAAILSCALFATTSAFATETSYPRAGSGGGPGRADFLTQNTETTGSVIGASTAKKPTQAGMVRSGTGGGNSLGGRTVARPFVPTPEHALNSDN